MKCDRDGKQPSSTVSLQKSRSVACVPSFCQHRNTSAWSREEEAGLRGRGSRGGGGESMMMMVVVVEVKKRVLMEAKHRDVHFVSQQSNQSLPLTER